MNKNYRLELKKNKTSVNNFRIPGQRKGQIRKGQTRKEKGQTACIGNHAVKTNDVL